MKKILVLLAALAGLAVVVAGCGSSSDTTESTASISKAEFVKEGNAICKKGNQEIEQGFGAFAKENNLSQTQEPSEAQFEEIATTVLIPSIQNQIDGVRALGAPEGEEEKVEEFLESAETALEEVEEEPSVLAEENNAGPFAAVNKEAREVGLTTCGEEEES